MKKKWQYKAVFYSMVGMIIVILLTFLFRPKQSHNATDPGPDVVEKLPELKGIVKGFNTSYFDVGDVLVLGENGGLRKATPEELEYIDSIAIVINEGYRKFEHTFTIRPNPK